MQGPKQAILEFRVCRLRDREAFAELYGLHQPKIYNFLRSRVGRDEIAEDLTADVFLKACRAIFEEAREVRSFRGFIYTLARYAAIDYLRAGGEREVLFREEQDFEREDERVQIERDADIVISYKKIEQVLRNINPEYREAIELRYLAELDISEMAEVLGKSRGAVSVLIHRAMRAIRERL